MSVVSIVLYANEDNIKFDMNYYLKKHMPMVLEIWGPFGLIDW
jgi:hypothetical protein